MKQALVVAAIPSFRIEELERVAAVLHAFERRDRARVLPAGRLLGRRASLQQRGEPVTRTRHALHARCAQCAAVLQSALEKIKQMRAGRAHQNRHCWG